MDQVVKMVQERTGIDAGQARTAVSTVLEFLKERLPEPIAGQIDGVVSGSGEGGTGSPMDQASSMFGGGDR